MAAISELLRSEEDGSLSFGDYTLDAKTKLDGFEHNGDLYKVKTFKEITRLEKNDSFLFESVPGTAVRNLTDTPEGVAFNIEGPEDVQVTLELRDNTKYAVVINGEEIGEIETNMSGKLTFGIELAGSDGAAVSVKKI